MTFRFEPRGLLALAPQAYGQTFDLAMPCEPAWLCGSADEESAPQPIVAVVTIRGPLMHHVQPWERNQPPPPDCYDDIRSRVAFALRMPGVAAIVLSIDSPGGLVSGCFDNARMVRDMADAAGVPMHAYIDGQCCSAAYAWACVCDTVTAPETAVVGSIGVLDCIVDATAADRQMGLKFALIASGARKTDGNPHNALSEETLTAAQARVDDLASFFFDFVAEHRAGLTADAVRALQAETYTGARAQTLQLVDNVLTLDALVASLTADPTGNNNMAGKFENSQAALMAEADSDDPKVASRAKRAIAAMYAEEEDGGDAPAPAKKKDDEEASTKAEGDSEEPPKKKDEEASTKAAAVASPAAVVASASNTDARLDKIEADQHAQRMQARRDERRNLLAARPDIGPTMLAVLSDPKQTSLETLRAILPTIEKPTGVKASATAQSGGAAPIAGGETGSKPGTAADNAPRDGYTVEDLDRQMGLYKAPVVAHWNGSNFVQPILTPAQARAQLAETRAQSQKAGAQ